MAKTTNTNPSRFHNVSDAALADMLGRADAVAKAAEAELKALKDELKARGVEEIVGDEFTVTAKEQIAGRADTAALKAHLGAAYSRFEMAVISTVVRVRAVNRLALAA